MEKKQMPQRTKLFHFTELDEIRMRRAIIDSQKFMETYGKGSRQQMVDLSRYANSNYRHEEKEQQ